MTKILVTDLIGKNIAGMRAIVTAPLYRNQYPNGVPVRELIKIEWQKERGARWLRLYWKRDGSASDCGYSGWREDCEALKERFVEVLSAGESVCP